MFVCLILLILAAIPAVRSQDCSGIGTLCTLTISVSGLEGPGLKLQEEISKDILEVNATTDPQAFQFPGFVEFEQFYDVMILEQPEGFSCVLQQTDECPCRITENVDLAVECKKLDDVEEDEDGDGNLIPGINNWFLFIAIGLLVVSGIVCYWNTGRREAEAEDRDIEEALRVRPPGTPRTPGALQLTRQLSSRSNPSPHPQHKRIRSTGSLLSTGSLHSVETPRRITPRSPWAGSPRVIASPRLQPGTPAHARTQTMDFSWSVRAVDADELQRSNRAIAAAAAANTPEGRARPPRIFVFE